MLRNVCKRLRAEEIHNRLDVRRQPRVRGRYFDRNRGLLCERRERALEPDFGEDTGMEPIGELAELLEGVHELVLASVDPLPGSLDTRGEARLAKSLGKPPQPPLRALAEPLLEAPAFLVAGLEDSPPRVLQLGYLGAHLGP